MSDNKKQNYSESSTEKLKNLTKHNLNSTLENGNLLESPEKTQSKRFKQVTPTKAVDILNTGPTVSSSTHVEERLPLWVAGFFLK